MQSYTLSARWILPVASPPLERGTITIQDDRILAVDPQGTRPIDHDLGDVAVLPGLVNAHTHLDLSGLRERIPFDGEFTHWLRGVIGYRRGLAADDVQRAVRAGIAESISHGVTLLGDIASQGLSWDLLAGAPVRSIVYHELIGLAPDRAKLAWQAFETWKADHPDTYNCRGGVSPHAPYSAAFSLVGQAFDSPYPVAIHLAETLAERELLEHHNGPFVPFLQGVGAWEPTGLAPNFGAIVERSHREKSVLFAHGNYLVPQDPIPPNATIVYCPRTHAYFGHDPHPFHEMLARGVRVALGTDSRASNPDLDLLAEARFLHHLYPDLAGDLLLRLATIAGAEALGWADEVGSLTPGKSADLVVVPLPAASGDPYRLVFDSDLPVSRVLWRGRWIYDGRDGDGAWEGGTAWALGS